MMWCLKPGGHFYVCCSAYSVSRALCLQTAATRAAEERDRLSDGHARTSCAPTPPSMEEAPTAPKAIAQLLPAWRLLQLSPDALEELVPHLVCMGEAHGSATGPAWRALGSNAEVHVALHMAAMATGSVSGTLSHQSQAQPAGGMAMPRFVKLSAVPRVPYSFLLITAHQGQWPQAAPRSGSADLPLSDGVQQCAQSLRHLLIRCPDACDALIQLVETHDNPDNMEAAVVMPAGHPQGTQATKHGLSMSTSSEPCRCSASCIAHPCSCVPCILLCAEGCCLEMSHALVDAADGKRTCSIVLEFLQPGAGRRGSSASQTQSVPAGVFHRRSCRRSVSILGGTITATEGQTQETCSEGCESVGTSPSKPCSLGPSGNGSSDSLTSTTLEQVRCASGL